jgi:tRNA pseudouridine38-40 synthase
MKEGSWRREPRPLAKPARACSTYHGVERRRYALRIAYEGGAFRGFQRQPGLPTVEGALRAALAPLGLSPHLEVAARTDAGVHALDQLVTFSARAEVDPAALRAAVNGATPPELLCLDAWRTSPRFHARSSALSRTYLYLVGLPPPPELARYAWTLPDPRAFPGVEKNRLDVQAMSEALGSAVGEHDFVGFARPGEQRGTVRSVLRAEVSEATWAPLYAVLLEGRGFLRAQVRNLVGTAVAVGLGIAPASRIADLLRARGRYRGVRAPGWGLTLVDVDYPADEPGCYGFASSPPPSQAT